MLTASVGFVTPSSPVSTRMVKSALCGPNQGVTGFYHSLRECQLPPSPPPPTVTAGIPSDIARLESDNMRLREERKLLDDQIAAVEARLSNETRLELGIGAG